MESAGKGDLISVVIPVYNAEKTVARALESVLASDCKNLEAIVVYRDSADNTLEIVKSLADSRVKIVRQGSPTGPGGARNLGIAASSGDWLAFAESDDFVPPNFYPALLAGAKTLGCDIAWGEILCGGEKWNRLGTARVLKTFKQKFSPITNGASFDKLYSARLIKGRKIEFMEGVRYEDNPFVFKAFFYANKIAAGPEAEYCYCFERKSPEQEEKLKNDVLPVAENILSFFSYAGAGEAEL